MLLNLKEILEIAERDKIAVGAFNAPNISSLLAIIEAAEELNCPVIISHAQGHEEFVPIHIIGPAMLSCAKKSNVPICVHLDHCNDISYAKSALDIGFTGIMYDGSTLPFDENVSNTRLVIKMAKEKGAALEGEIGVMGKMELGIKNDENEDEGQIYTDPDDAYRFVINTNVDALACSFGTVHGLYLKEPKLDFSIVERVREKIMVPIVMHGGSGVSEENYKKAIESGVRKINYYTYMSKAGGEAVRSYINKNNENLNIYFHDIAKVSQNAMKENVKSAMKIFSR